MNFSNWLYTKSKHPKRLEALKTLKVGGLSVLWAVPNQQWFVLYGTDLSTAIVLAKFATKIEVIEYLATLQPTEKDNVQS